MTHRLRPFFTIFILAAASAALCAGPGQSRPAAGAEKRESIFDRNVVLVKPLMTEIPVVPRLCDSLALEKKRVSVGDCELYVEEEGRGTPLVLVNGGPGGTHHYFHPWFGRTADFARVIYYDQRGCGLSDYNPGPDGYTVEQAVADLDAVRNALGIEKWAVLGYSYGGFLAQYYATKYPERLAGLVLLGAVPGMWVEMKPTRQYDFLSPEEQARIRDIGQEITEGAAERQWPPEKTMALRVYNNHLNGDWKRQHVFKPSPEKLARKALYEWIFDLKNNFRSGISKSQDLVDLTGAFDRFPVPTLICEGKWDLTWNTDKPEILAGNHPGAKLVVFEKAGHAVYDEEPEAFFAALQDFVVRLPAVSPAALASYKSTATEWDRLRRSSPLYYIRAAGFGRAGLTELAKAYKREWCDTLKDWPDFGKLGFAQYETANYAEGLQIFELMERAAENKQNASTKALALIWQGHMLDLLGRRAEAVARYKTVVDMNIKDTWKHSTYGLQYEVSAYSRERMEKPFVRVENKEKAP
ncbi:MAG: alpha/beta fold hydrolase [Candidatus Aminicenantes bacterium]|nr:alpha/beta fold hydrolase [Candidatus Aminicenantes bacterium]